MIFADRKQSVKDVIDILKPCRVTYSKNCVYIESDGEKYMFNSSGTKLNFKELSYVKEFRTFFKKNGENIDYNKDYINYPSKFIHFYKKVGTFSDVVQIDINNAYPTAANILGIIPEYLFEKGKLLTKQARLVAIGSLHRNRKIIDVDEDGNRTMVQNFGEERIDYLSDIWRSIVGYVDYAIDDVCNQNKSEVFFYWCDAIFVRTSSQKRIIEGLKRHGFETKIVPIDRIEADKNGFNSFPSDGSDSKQYLFPIKKYTIQSLDQLISRYEQKER